MPAAPRLEPVAPQVDPSAGAPAQPPTAYEVPAVPGKALRDLAPNPGDARDPRQPYAVASSTLTASSAWDSAHSTAAVAAPGALPPSAGSRWQADQPMHPAYPPPVGNPSGFPAPGTPDWFRAGPAGVPVAAPRPVAPTVGNTLLASTYGLLIVLAVGALIPVMAPVGLSVAAVLAGRARFRRASLQRVFRISVGVMVASALLPLLQGNVANLWDVVGLVACLLSWALLIFTVFTQYSAMVAGEQPIEKL